MNKPLHPNMNSGASSQRIQSLDSLRFIAATIVFFSHAQPISQVEWMHGLASWDLLNSKSAVAFFFVLSGLVLHFGLRKTTPSLPQTLRFLLRRYFRIYPLYYVSLILCLLLMQFQLDAVPNLIRDEVTARVLSQTHTDTLQWLHHLLLISPGLNFDYVNPPIWTLAAEMRVAFVLPILSFAIARLSFANGAILLGLSLFAAPWLAKVTVPTVSIIPLFMAGAWAAQHRDLFSRLRKIGSWFCLLAGLAIYTAAPSLSHQTADRNLLHFYLAGLGSLLIMMSIDKVEIAQKIIHTLTPRWLSDASYGLYVLHFPMLMGVAYLFWRFGLSFHGFVPTAYIITVAVALLAYHIIEAPMIWVGQKLTSKKA